LADPEYLQKAVRGREDEIRQCIGCNQGCIERLILEMGTIRCAINPETGQELIYPRDRATARRRIWVIGAGPAGLTAAYEASRLGHEVRLFEKEDRPGGQIRYASMAPYKELYAQWIEWLVTRVEALGVRIETGVTVTEAMLEEGEPEAIILAVGGEKIIPTIDGVDRPMVTDAWEILGQNVQGKENVVVVGGGLIGMEAADFLIARGSKVTLVEQVKKPPVTKMTSHGYMLHRRLRDGDCRFLFGAQVERIEGQAVIVDIDGQEETIAPVDQVVLAVGMRPREELKAAFEVKGIPHRVVGDAREVRRIIEATEEGAMAAWEL
jgi:NADPH-dependent 2,4-dienoyl-CoA reductase/sulfur reductase-like enzyme